MNRNLDNAPEFCKRNSIKGVATDFDQKWVERVKNYFRSETAAVSVLYEAVLQFEGVEGVHPGYVEVYRDGTFAVKLQH